MHNARRTLHSLSTFMNLARGYLQKEFKASGRVQYERELNKEKLKYRTGASPLIMILRHLLKRKTLTLSLIISFVLYGFYIQLYKTYKFDLVNDGKGPLLNVDTFDEYRTKVNSEKRMRDVGNINTLIERQKKNETRTEIMKKGHEKNQHKQEKQVNINKVPIILFYIPHPLLHFSIFDLKGVCPDYCIFTNNSGLYKMSEAVIFFQRLNKPPPIKLANQKWIFFTNEAPPSFFPSVWKKASVQFDWIMSYRPSSDFVLPFGTLSKRANYVHLNYSQIFQQKKKEVMWLVSNCKPQSLRDKYVEELRKHIEVDVYGLCGNRSCPTPGITPYERTSCKTILSPQYKFYLSFENMLCDNYISEKVYGLYEDNDMMVPVVRSAPNSASFLPNGTYISTSDFKSPKDLAMYLKKIGSSEEMYTSILKEKHRYKVTPWMEHYKQAICNICTRLQYPKSQSNHSKSFIQRLNSDKCYRPTDIP